MPRFTSSCSEKFRLLTNLKLLSLVDAKVHFQLRWKIPFADQLKIVIFSWQQDSLSVAVKNSVRRLIKHFYLWSIPRLDSVCSEKFRSLTNIELLSLVGCKVHFRLRWKIPFADQLRILIFIQYQG